MDSLLLFARGILRIQASLSFAALIQLAIHRFAQPRLPFLLHLLLRWDNQIVVGTVYCSDVDEWYEPFEVVN